MARIQSHEAAKESCFVPSTSTGALQAAIDDAATEGGGTVLVAGNHVVEPVSGGGLILKDKVRVLGTSKQGSLITFSGTFTDSLIRADRRDDNNQNTWEVVSLSNLRMIGTNNAVALLDLAGFRYSEFSGLVLHGTGAADSQTAIRLSDKNPAGTSAKSTFGISISNIANGGGSFGTFLKFSQTLGDCNTHLLENLFGNARVAFDFTDNAGQDINSTFTVGYLAGDDHADSAVFKNNVVPAGASFRQIGYEGYTLAPTFNLEPRGIFVATANTPIIAQGSIMGANLLPIERAFSALPISPRVGMLATVNDSNTATVGATVAAGGANNVLARYDGSVWKVVA